MTSRIHRATRWLAVGLVFAWMSATPASAFEAHNLIEPPLGPIKETVGPLAVNEATGNVYAASNSSASQADSAEIDVLGPGGGPSSFTGSESIDGRFKEVNGIAVDNACWENGLSGAECEAFDPSNEDIYISEFQQIVSKYRLNSANQYEYVCAFRVYAVGNKCYPNGEGNNEEPEGSRIGTAGVAVDSAGDVYMVGRIGFDDLGVFEFSAAGEALNAFAVPQEEFVELGNDNTVAVAANGTLYLRTRLGVSVELRRSSLTGPVEGEPSVVPNTEGERGFAFDRSTGQLLVDVGSSGDALDGAHEVVSRFGSGIINSNKGQIAVDEATGEVYVGNEKEHDIDRFSGGVSANLPAVDAPPPSLADVTRTSALLSGTVATGDATTSWHLEYVGAEEYQPGAANPYAAGRSTLAEKLAPSVLVSSVGPVPLTGLLAGTTYHYRLVATNELGTTYGNDHSFTTAAATPPAATTGAASEITQTGVMLSGTVGTQELQTSYAFEVGLDTSYGGAKLFGNAGSNGVETVSASLQYLIPGTTYHYRLVAINEDGTTYGQDMTFTTPGVAAGIAQPSTTVLLPSPSVQFPLVAGAITKAQGQSKKKKTKTRKRAKKKTAAHKRGKRKKAAGRHA